MSFTRWLRNLKSAWYLSSSSGKGRRAARSRRPPGPAEADARVNLHSVSGDVRSEFAELRRSSAPASRSVSGSLGAGSGQVSVTTMSGRVMLLRRAEPHDTRAAQQPDNENEMEGEAS